MKKTRLVIAVIILWFWAMYLSLFRKHFAKKDINYTYKHYMSKTARLIRWTYNINFEIIGQENITESPQLITLNHRSYADSTLSIFSLDTTNNANINHKAFIYIAKAELNKTFIYRSFIRLTKVIFLIDRNNLRQSIYTFREIAKLSWQNKLSIVIFPEGTRNKTRNHLLPFKPAALKLASLNKLPILPGVFINNENIWNFKRKKKINVKLIYGKEIASKELIDLSSQELCDLVSQRMIELIEKHKQDN